MQDNKLKDKQWLNNELHGKERTVKDIAKELGVTERRVRYAMKKMGVKSRSRSDAIKLALKQNRLKHPTKGKARSKKERESISRGVAKSWEKMDPEKRKAYSERAKRLWEDMEDERKKEMLKRAAQMTQKTSRDGSKLEKSLYESLTRSGYIVEFHREGLIPNHKLQLDMFVPELRTAIEIDGPAHFYPIYGEEALQKNIKSDKEKSGLILAHGMVMLRIKHLHDTVSDKVKRDVYNAVKHELQKIEKQFPPEGKRLIEIEV
jgi:very-short-patch-repair endonuclease